VLALPSKVDRLVDAVRELADTQHQQAEQIRALAEARQRTEERLEVRRAALLSRRQRHIGASEMRPPNLGGWLS
jgi:hypothetical protein